ncbi:protein jagged-1b-like [Lineus longissimus]|uniref:protein jagged-1b-like n=1 Tax=Lineus longissimus TaxID=88925 RepID=UPI002B4C2E2F
MRIVLMLGLVTLVLGQSQERGFSKTEKQLMLDLFNFFRNKVALGKEPRQPASRYMLAMEYDDRLQKTAQAWADKCKPEHSHGDQRNIAPFGELGESLSGGPIMAIKNGFERAFLTWYGEEPHYTFDTRACKGIPACGHYMQIVWANSTRMGCGFNRCPGKAPVIFCHFGPSGNAQYYKDAKVMWPYVKGSASDACKHCPQGYGFCMGDALCASAEECRGQQCRCTLTSCSNGGQLDSGSCKCKCPSGWEGATCNVRCADHDSRLCADEPGSCKYDSGRKQWALEACRKSCGFCGVYNVKNIGNAPNKDGVISRVLKKQPGGIFNRKRGNCKDDKGEEMCGVWADQDKCNERTVRVACRGTCFACGSLHKGKCKDRIDAKKCKYYADHGWCEDKKYKNMLAKDCASTCNMCGEYIPVKTGGKQKCKNLLGDDVACARYKEQYGYCEKRTEWMRVNCAATCNICPDLKKGNCKNIADDTRCDKYAARGMCKGDRGAWTRENCPSSCNTCP